MPAGERRWRPRPTSAATALHCLPAALLLVLLLLRAGAAPADDASLAKWYIPDTLPAHLVKDHMDPEISIQDVVGHMYRLSEVGGRTGADASDGRCHRAAARTRSHPPS